jgi:hypothetical protein
MVLESFNCEICTWRTEETVEHLFWHCPFAQQCWGILNLQTVPNGNSIENIAAIKIQLHSQFFMTTIIIMLWTIWKARNELIFNNNQIGIQECTALFSNRSGLSPYG